MLYGLDTRQLPNCKNLGLPSQDLYYAFLLAKKMYSVHPYKRLLLGGHYYSIFSDLSRVKDVNELSRITKVYSRIFPHSLGLHNAFHIPNQVDERVISGIYDIDKIQDLVIKSYFDSWRGSYWNKNWSRFAWRMRLWQGERTWAETTQEEKNNAAKFRTDSHNKNISYKDSLKENVILLNELGEWCLKKKVQLNIINFPVSESYSKTEDKNFKKIYYEAIKGLRFPAKLYDFEQVKFGDECFNDPDHLNDAGAEKLTKILLQNV